MTFYHLVVRQFLTQCMGLVFTKIKKICDWSKVRLSLSVPPSDLSILHLEKIIYQYFPINVACSTKCENCKNNLSLFYFKCCQMTVLFIGNIHIENKLDKTHTLFHVEANHVTKMTYYKKCWLIVKNYNVI